MGDLERSLMDRPCAKTATVFMKEQGWLAGLEPPIRRIFIKKNLYTWTGKVHVRIFLELLCKVFFVSSFNWLKSPPNLISLVSCSRNAGKSQLERMVAAFWCRRDTSAPSPRLRNARCYVTSCFRTSWKWFDFPEDLVVGETPTLILGSADLRFVREGARL